MLIQGAANFSAAVIALFSSSLNLPPPSFSTVNDIPPEYFTEKKTIYGRVERVIDGDTIRVTHCPTRSICPELDPSNRKISDKTLSLRIYGVDCPELQKRKSDPPSQPFAKKAKELTSDLVLNKEVEIKLFRKDQYGRAVAKIVNDSSQDVSMELVQNGLAFVYTGKGAQYDGNRDLLEEYQRQAQERNRGAWSLGKDLVTPAEFKRQQKLNKLEEAVAPMI